MSAPTSLNLEHAATGFLKEVDDALHEERLLALWQRYKWLVVGVVVVLLAGTLLREGWQAWQQRQDEAAAVLWQAYSQAADADTRARKLAPLLDAASPGFRALALTSKAEAEPAAAAASYGDLATDGSQPAWIQQLAAFNQALVLIADKPAEARAQLEPMAAGGLLQAPALEVLAALAMAAGDTAAARRHTELVLTLPNLPAGLRARAEKRMGALSTLTN